MRREVVIAVSAFVLTLFWFFAVTNNVYHYVIVGVICEILWLPMIIMLVVLPTLCIYYWRMQQWRFKTIYPYCLLMNISTMLLLYFNS